MGVGNKIKAVRKELGLTQLTVATAAGTDTGNLSRIESEKQVPSAQMLIAIAAAMGVPLDRLTSDAVTSGGRLSDALSDSVNGRAMGHDAYPGRVPLVPWTRLGEWQELTDANRPGLKWYPISKEVPFGKGAASELSGDSMTQDGKPSFPHGTVIVIEAKAAKPGDFVLVRLPSGERTFKKLVEDAGIRYLEPLNPRYPLVPFEGEILGVLIEAATRQTFP